MAGRTLKSTICTIDRKKTRDFLKIGFHEKEQNPTYYNVDGWRKAPFAGAIENLGETDPVPEACDNAHMHPSVVAPCLKRAPDLKLSRDLGQLPIIAAMRALDAQAFRSPLLTGSVSLKWLRASKGLAPRTSSTVVGASASMRACCTIPGTLTKH